MLPPENYGLEPHEWKDKASTTAKNPWARDTCWATPAHPQHRPLTTVSSEPKLAVGSDGSPCSGAIQLPPGLLPSRDTGTRSIHSYAPLSYTSGSIANAASGVDLNYWLAQSVFQSQQGSGFRGWAFTRSHRPPGAIQRLPSRASRISLRS